MREKPKRGGCASVHAGRPSILAPTGDQLMTWLLQKRDQGVMVSMRLVVVQASGLCARFRRKSARSKDQAVQQFLSTNRIVMRAVTHTCQRLPHQVRKEALDFICDVREKVVGENRSLKYIINMDQTPVFFDMSTGKTLSKAGKNSGAFLVSFSFKLPPSITNHNPRHHMQVQESLMGKRPPHRRLEQPSLRLSPHLARC